jgi:predicted SAM-dependent methyltransferase
MKGFLRSVLRDLHLLEAVRRSRHGFAAMRLDWARTARGVDRKLIAAHMALPVRKLHIGCQLHVLPGWLNADIHPPSDEVLCLDATKNFQLEGGSFDYVFSEHMIEHIPYDKGLAMLRECHRILRPGGRIRITTPNLAFLVNLYRNDGDEQHAGYIGWATKQFIPWAPYADRSFVINNFVRDWGHQFIYDAPTLARAMADCGFVQVSEKSLHQSGDPALTGIENETRAPAGFVRMESITLEAVKSPS